MKQFIALWLALGRLPFPVYRVLSALISGVLTPMLLLLAVERRRIVFTNLRLCFPASSPWQRLVWCVQHLYFYVQTFLDRSWLWGGNTQHLQERVHIQNPEALACLNNPKPTIFLAPHFLGLDAAWSRLSVDLNMVTMYSNQKNPVLNQLVFDGRSKYGQPILLSRQQGIRPLVAAMKKGHPLYYLPDMDFGAKDSVFVKFFGIDAATVTAVSRLSSLLNAQVVPITTRYRRGQYWVHIHEPFQHYPLADETASTQYMNHQIETWVEDNIPQYLWLHKRFKTRPTGAPNLY